MNTSQNSDLSASAHASPKNSFHAGPPDIAVLPTDNSQYEATIQALHESEERFRILAEAAFEALCIGENGIMLEVNDQFCCLFDYSRDDLIGMSAIELTDPSCHELVKSRIENKDDRAYEALGRRRDGTLFHCEIQGRRIPFRGKQARVTAIRDITERRRAQSEQRVESARLNALVENLQAGILVEDEDGRIRLCNRYFCEIFGLAQQPEELIGADYTVLKEADQRMFADPAAFKQRIEDISKRRETVINEEIKLRDGRVFERDYIPIFVDDRFLNDLWEYRDVTAQRQNEAQIVAQKGQLEEANAQLEELAATDGLTQISNRRAFDRAITDEFTRARRYDTPLSMLMLDVDRFKNYNDTFGHQAGDEVLRQLADLLKHIARDIDFVARYGGEEFAAILPGIDQNHARLVAERFRSAVEAAEWENRAITISVGATTLTPDHNDPCALIENADAALYRAKKSGRNRVAHAAERD